jgi:hypothetical protein
MCSGLGYIWNLKVTCLAFAILVHNFIFLLLGDDLPEGRNSFDATVAAPLPPGVSLLKIISDYLRAMKDFIFSILGKSGINAPATDIMWCLTVPSVWTDQAKFVGGYR